MPYPMGFPQGVLCFSACAHDSCGDRSLRLSASHSVSLCVSGCGAPGKIFMQCSGAILRPRAQASPSWISSALQADACCYAAIGV